MLRIKRQSSYALLLSLLSNLSIRCQDKSQGNFQEVMANILSRKAIFLAKIVLLSTFLLFPIKYSQANSEAVASTIEDLIAKQKLIVSVSTKLDEPAIVGQPIKISIEVATERWFSKGTRLKEFEAQNVVVLPFEQLAINGSKSINRQTWTTQTREFSFYPTEAGTLQLPPIELFISINGENNKIIEGSVTLDVEPIDVGYPSTLTEKDSYIVSSDFSLEVQSDAKPEGNYAVGEAVTVTYVFEADGLPGMMLPQIRISANDGVSIYRKPADVYDKQNRGSLVGTRIESFSFIFEKSGDYTFPEQKLLWWDINAEELKEAVVPEQNFKVKGLLPSTRSTTQLDILKSPKTYAVMLLLVVAVYALLKLYSMRERLRIFYRKIFNLDQRALEKQFIESINKKSWLAACDLLYQVHHLPSIDTKALGHLFNNDESKAKTLNKLFNLAFYEKGNKIEDKSEAISLSDLSLSIAEAKALLKPSLSDTKSTTDNLLKLN